MTAVLQAANGNSERIAQAIAECNRLGIAVLQPDVNRSGVNFTIEVGNGGAEAIRYGLAQIKNVGMGGVEGLISEREAKGDFETIEDFARRINPHDVNKRVIEALAKSGALDGLGDRGAIVTGVDRLSSLAQQEQRLRDTGQTSMFDMFGDEVNTPLPALEFDQVLIPQPQLLAWEKELLGTYISEHPFSRAARTLGRYTSHQCAEISAELNGQDAILAGLVAGIRPLQTKQGKGFAAVTIEDLSGQAEIMVWSDAYEKLRETGILVEGTILLAKTNVRLRGDRVSAGVLEICAYDQEAERLVNFDANKFQPRSASRGGWQQRAVAETPGQYRTAPPPSSGPTDRGPGGPSGGGPNGGSRQDAPATRPSHLSVVARDAEDEAAAAPTSAPRVDEGGLHRLVIEMEETTDEAADLRRLHKVCAVLDRFEGDLPVELRVKTRGGQQVSLGRGSVDGAELERIVASLRPILGVLGGAREAGSTADAARGELAAVGGEPATTRPLGWLRCDEHHLAPVHSRDHRGSEVNADGSAS